MINISSVVDGGMVFVCHFEETFSGQRSTSWNLLGLRLYLCSSGFGLVGLVFFLKLHLLVYI